MEEINILCNKVSPQGEFGRYIITVNKNIEENLLYKFLIGKNGTWKTLKDFSEDNSIEWKPNEDGYHIIMVQAKNKESTKSFDYMAKFNCDIGNEERELIRQVDLNKNEFKIGEKISVTVEPLRLELMYRYWLWEDNSWKIIKEYSGNNTISFTVSKEGYKKLLVQCKEVNSSKDFDDFKEIEFTVQQLKILQIKNFKSVVTEILVEKELIFQVDSEYEDNRIVLYKFIKLNPDGSAKCVQDYSTKRLVNFTEKNPGNYKLLCLAKDMYSMKEYDDRAILNYEVRAYKPICIKEFTTDLVSPQIIGTSIKVKPIVEGGKKLLFRYIIKGQDNIDTGYIKNNFYNWTPLKPGDYSIELRVKDESFQNDYEDKRVINYSVDEVSAENVVIEEVLVNKNSDIIINEDIEMQVVISGGLEPKYNYILYFENEKIQSTEYSSNNIFTYKPNKAGNYKLEVRVKDKYSQKIFDCHSSVYFKVRSFIPATIDYVLTEPKEYYRIGEKLDFEVVCSNTKKSLTRYMVKIDGHIVEESSYEEHKKYEFYPRCSGTYTFEFYVKNKESNQMYDSKKIINITVKEAHPITNTRIYCDKREVICNEAIVLTAECEGGKEVLYEFYLMENGEWNLVQKFSKKNYYSFIPFKEEVYKVLVLTKSSYKKEAYEDFCIFQCNAIQNNALEAL